MMYTNTYTEEEVKVWLVWDGDTVVSLQDFMENQEEHGPGDLFPARDFEWEDVGEVPDWLDYQLSDSDWDSLVDFRGWRHDGTQARHVMGLGLTIDQPFLFQVLKPTSHYYDEGPDYETEILEISPLPAGEWNARWEKFEAAVIASEKAQAESKAEEQRQIKAILSDLDPADERIKLRSDVYFAPGQSAIDSMEMPAGSRVRLSVNPTGRVYGDEPIASGEDHAGRFEVALSNLASELGKLGHNVPVATLHKMWRGFSY